jgi:formate-dependent nitrite reductase membrane component NrfD
VLVIATGMFDFGEWRQFSVSIASLHILVLSLMLNLAMVTFEVFRPHATADSQRAVATMTRGRLSFRFWGLAVGLGMVVPLLLFMGIVSDQSPPLAEVLVAVLALLGLWFYEDIWVKAGQSVPLS